jgi:Ser/Thr protein kinase RdoA (MazF antagonist)
MTPPEPVIAAWGWHDADIAPITGGLINATFAVRRAGEPIAVVQRLHPVFGAAVNLDIEAVTAHLARHGMVTPRLVRTGGGAPYVEHEGAVWRALSWVDGVAVHKVPDPSWARAGGELVGRFHRAVHDLEHTYHFARAGVHDTAAHLARLRAHVERGITQSPGDLELAREVLDAANDLPPMPDLPSRHAHGDLKISNLLFDRDPLRAVALVDLDTLGRQTLAFELGDAMRSWCNPHGEDAGSITFDLAIFAAAIAGWRDVAGGLFDERERAAIVVGLETVCIELAARFTTDVFDDRYFGWDAARFPSRRAHNLVRAQGQLALGRAVSAARADAHEIVQQIH